MRLGFSRLQLSPVGWGMVLTAGIVLGVGLARAGMPPVPAMIVGVGSTLLALWLLDGRAQRKARRRATRTSTSRRRRA